MVAHPKIDTTTPDHIAALRASQTQLARAVGQGQPALRDPAGNILALNPASSTPLLTAQGHDVALSMRSGFLSVTDETGTNNRGIYSDYLGAASYVSTVDVYTSTVSADTQISAPTLTASTQMTAPTMTADNAYTTLHGDSNGTHYGDIGEPGSGNPGHNVYSDTYGKHFGDLGSPSENWHNIYGNHYGQLSGDSFGTHTGDVAGGYHVYSELRANHFGDCTGTHYGAVVAPSERQLKSAVKDFPEAGGVIDAVPAYRWRWGAEEYDDGREHAGPMVDDIAEQAPWLVHHSDDTEIRSLADRDLLGVLWAALRDARSRIAELETQQPVTALETRMTELTDRVTALENKST